jgi:putative transposase
MTLFKNKYRVESTRLKDHDYSEKGDYYITICMKLRTPFFGDIINGKMALNNQGTIAEEQWKSLEKNFPNIKLDDFIIMPDHIHGIIQIRKQTDNTLSNIIQSFKSKTAIKINKECDVKCVWQKRFYDRIIRDEFQYYFTSEYIKNNPVRYMPGNEDKEWWELYEEREKAEDL